MELNELNKSTMLNFLAQSPKNNIASGVLGEGFAELLNTPVQVSKTDSQLASSLKLEKKTSKIETDSYKKTDVNSNENVKNEKPENKGKKEVSKTKNADSVNTKDATPDKKSSVPSSETIDNTSKNAQDIEAGEDDIVEGFVPQAPVKDDVSQENVQIISLDALALMGSLQIVIPETAEVVTVSGVDLAKNITLEEGQQLLLIPVDGQENTFKLAISNPSDSQNLNISPVTNELSDVLAGFQVVSTNEDELAYADINKIVKPTAKKAESFDVPEDDMQEFGTLEIDKQAKEIASKLPSESNVKIEVSTKEENFTQFTKSTLLADISEVDVAVSGVESDAPISSVTTPATSSQDTNLSSVVAPIQINEVQEKVSVINKGVSEISSSSLGQIASQNSEVANHKVETAANDKTSFKDVYKGLSKENIDAIKVNITKSAVKGVDKIQIQLKPEDLGNIEVKLQIGKDGKVQAHLIASRPETVEFLQKDMQTLEKAFSNAGFQMDEGSLSFSYRNEQQTNQERKDFIGGILEKNVSSDIRDIEEYSVWDGQTALNIRV